MFNQDCFPFKDIFFQSNLRENEFLFGGNIFVQSSNMLFDSSKKRFLEDIIAYLLLGKAKGKCAKPSNVTTETDIKYYLLN
jgi:hypothetical protein